MTKKYIYLMLIPVLSIGILAFTQKGTRPKKCQPNKNRICFVTPTELPMAIVGEVYSIEIRIEGGRPPYNWRVLGDLPPGLVFTPNGDGTLVVTGESRATVVAFLNRLKDSE